MSGNEVEVFRGIGRARLEEILAGIRKVKVALVGDICLDVYWKADMTKSELSRETPHFPLPVVEERMSPGAGGNAAANIAALEPEKVFVLGVMGEDWRGNALISELHRRNIDTSGIIISESRVTNAYCKPLRRGISDVEYEDPRLDFSNYEPLSSEDEGKLIELLRQIAPQVDIICIADQFEFGCITPLVRDQLIRLAKQGMKVVADSRDRIGHYTDVILKPNEIEGYRAVYKEGDPRKASFEQQIAAAKTLAAANRSRICMTLGPKGCLYIDEHTITHIPSYYVKPPIDICGAGDTFLSAFSTALAAGAEPSEAASFANMAANVTIAKIGTTGTASPEEIRNRHAEILNIWSERQ